MSEPRTVRLDLRVPAEKKTGYEETAAMEGLTLTAWLLRVADVAAAESFWRRRRIEIARTDRSSTDSG